MSIFFKVEQNGVEYHSVKLTDLANLAEFWGDIYSETRLLLDQDMLFPRFNDMKAFTIVFGSGMSDEQRLEIPAVDSLQNSELPSFNPSTLSLHIPYVSVGSDYYEIDLQWDGEVFRITTLNETNSP